MCRLSVIHSQSVGRSEAKPLLWQRERERAGSPENAFISALPSFLPSSFLHRRRRCLRPSPFLLFDCFFPFLPFLLSAASPPPVLPLSLRPSISAQITRAVYQSLSQRGQKGQEGQGHGWFVVRGLTPAREWTPAARSGSHSGAATSEAGLPGRAHAVHV